MFNLHISIVFYALSFMASALVLRKMLASRAATLRNHALRTGGSLQPLFALRAHALR